MNFLILENCEELEVTEAEALELVRLELIYHCPVADGGHFEDGSGCDFFHTYHDGFEKVKAALKEIRTATEQKNSH